MTARRPSGFGNDAIQDNLRSFGGEADLVNVYAWISRCVNLWPRGIAESPHGGRLHFVKTVRGIANDMVDAESGSRAISSHVDERLLTRVEHL